MSVRLLAVPALVALGFVPLAAQRPLNLDFGRSAVADSTMPWGWSLGWSAFAAGPAARYALDAATRLEGRRSLRIVTADTAAEAPDRALAIQIPAGFARGRELALTGWIKTEGLKGRAVIQLEEWLDRQVGAADSAVVRGVGGSTDWTRHELRIRIPRQSAAHSVYLAVAVQGRGTAWFGPMTLTLDGRPITAIPSAIPPLTTAERAALARRSTPLVTVNPSPEADGPDLRRIGDLIGSARVVGLGESTHGTREFFQLKHRILQHLVKRRGFSVFALEANQLAIERTNRYVAGGAGTAADAMRAMFAVWNTEEMRALVEWVREHNRSNPGAPVRFVGYDMQDQRLPADTLLAFVRRVDPGFVARVESATSEYRAQPSWATPQMPDSVRARWRDQAARLSAEVAARRAGWLARARSPADTLAAEWAVQSANLFLQTALLNASLNSPDRDSLMAANLDWALRTLVPGQRAVVWAHDVHVSHGGDRQRSFNAGAQMGAHVKRTFGHDYRAFSLLTFQGEYTGTRSLSDFTMITARATDGPEGSMEALLHAQARPPGAIGFVVDLRSDSGDPRDRWLWTARPIRHIGYAAYDYGFDLTAVFPLEFDGILFVDRSEASRPLR